MPDKRAMDDAIKAANERHGEGSVVRTDRSYTKRHEERAQELRERLNAEILRAQDGAPVLSFTSADLIASALAVTEAELVGRMMGPHKDPTFTAMLLAAGEVPLERENGGIEVAPFKIWKAMLAAFARENNIPLPEKEDAK